MSENMAADPTIRRRPARSCGAVVSCRRLDQTSPIPVRRSDRAANDDLPGFMPVASGAKAQHAADASTHGRKRREKSQAETAAVEAIIAIGGEDSR
jgi:hypothetical protein